MADPIQNAQFALGLFAPVLQTMQRNNAQNLAMAQRNADIARQDALRLAEEKRQDAFNIWKLKEGRADAEKEREFRKEQADNALRASTFAQITTNERAIAAEDRREQRAKAAAVNALYADYTELKRDDAAPLASFGDEPQDQYEKLSREVGKLKQTVLLGQGVAKLAEEYKKLGGDKKVNDFGNTPADQIQGLSSEINKLTADRTKRRYANVNRELSSVSEQIATAEKLTPEEMTMAKSSGLNRMGKDAREAYLRFRKVMSEEAALAKVANLFPADVEEFRSGVNQTVMGLRIQKRDSDKILRELYDTQSQLRMARMKAANDMYDSDSDSLGEIVRPSASASAPATAPARASAADLLASPAGKVSDSDVRRAVMQPAATAITPKNLIRGYAPMGAVGESETVITEPSPASPASVLQPYVTDTVDFSMGTDPQAIRADDNRLALKRLLGILPNIDSMPSATSGGNAWMFSYPNQMMPPTKSVTAGQQRSALLQDAAPMYPARNPVDWPGAISDDRRRLLQNVQLLYPNSDWNHE